RRQDKRTRCRAAREPDRDAGSRAGAPREVPMTDATRQHYGVTFAVLALAGISYALLQSLVAPALPEIQRDLHTTTTSVTWVFTSFLLSASVATPIAGRLGDMFGKERTLLFVLLILAGGTLVSALAHSVGLL